MNFQSTAWEAEARSRGFELYENKSQGRMTWLGFILSHYALMKSGHLLPWAVRAQLPMIYRRYHGGRSALNTDEWVELFTYGGYRAGKPDDSDPITLYRGCDPRFKYNMSWTDSLETAKYFAGQNVISGIYRVTITRPEVIKFWPDTFVPERVIDPRGRNVELVPGTLKVNPRGRLVWPASRASLDLLPNMTEIIKWEMGREQSPVVREALRLGIDKNPAGRKPK